LEREARIRSDALITETLGIAFKDEEFPKTDKLKLLKKPLEMEDGAVFVWERSQQVVHLALEYQTWDDRLLRFGIDTSPRATMTEIFAAAQSKSEEPLEKASYYLAYSEGKVASLPLKSGKYTLKPKIEVAESVIVKFQGGSMTVNVPKFRGEEWPRRTYESLPDAPITCMQTGPKEFPAFYQDDIREWKAFFGDEDSGEEHEIRVLPYWQNQVQIVNEAFGRPMILDESRPATNGRIFVKSADGSPPDPTFERVMKYQLGDDPTEHKVRIHGGDTVEDVKRGIRGLHPKF
jgi:hypothetical protein